MLTRKTLATGVAASTIMFGFGAVAPAWATSNIQVLGVRPSDINGPLTGYTVTGLMPSSDPFVSGRQGGSSTGKVYSTSRLHAPASSPTTASRQPRLDPASGLAPEEVAPAASGGASSGGGGEGSTGPNQASPNTSGGEIGGGEGGTEGGGGNLIPAAAPARPAATRVNRAVLVCPPLSVVPASERQNRCRGSINSGCFCSSEFVARRRARRQSRLQVSGYGP